MGEVLNGTRLLTLSLKAHESDNDQGKERTSNKERRMCVGEPLFLNLLCFEVEDEILLDTNSGT